MFYIFSADIFLREFVHFVVFTDLKISLIHIKLFRDIKAKC